MRQIMARSNEQVGPQRGILVLAVSCGQREVQHGQKETPTNDEVDEVKSVLTENSYKALKNILNPKQVESLLKIKNYEKWVAKERFSMAKKKASRQEYPTPKAKDGYSEKIIGIDDCTKKFLARKEY